MNEYIKDISTNLFFILFLILLYQYWYEKKEWSLVQKRIAIFIFCAISIVLSMKFTYLNKEGIPYDLRFIPLIIGGLYGGIAVGIGLFLTLLILLIILEGTLSFWITAIIGFFITSFIFVVYRKFQTWRSLEKVFYIVMLCTYTALLIVVITEWMMRGEFIEQNYWAGYVISYIVGAWLTGNIAEHILQHEMIVRKLVINEKLKAVSHLASSISHEVRNPLTTSRGFMQLLKELDISSRYKEYIDIAIGEMDRAEEIIRGYLTFAKPSEEKTEIFPINLELQRAIDVMQPFAIMNNVTIHSILIEANIKGGRSCVQQCFINLMKNAIEAMPKGGELTIHSFIQNDHVIIQIKDTGIGMNKEQLSRLGEPYYSTKGTKGTGLGMMVVYRIIASMNGRVEVESEVEKGTCFTVILPLKKKLSQKESESKTDFCKEVV